MTALNAGQLSAKAIEATALNINPGGWAVEHERPIVTLLGSCVAVCLFDPKLQLAGMNHFLLPSRGEGRHADIDVVLAGDYAMEVLVNALFERGSRKQRLIAKAFGGGTIVSSIKTAIGERNIEFAVEWLKREGIPLVASDFGGAWSRKVICVPATGDAFCRRMPITQSVVERVIEDEAIHRQSLSKPKETRPQLFIRPV